MGQSWVAALRDNVSLGKYKPLGLTDPFDLGDPAWSTQQSPMSRRIHSHPMLTNAGCRKQFLLF